MQTLKILEIHRRLDKIQWSLDPLYKTKNKIVSIPQIFSPPDQETQVKSVEPSNGYKQLKF